jgi:hypothetical protein
MTRYRNTQADFWKLVDKTSNPNGCWEWQGNLDSGNGKTSFVKYGVWMFEAKRWKAHRLSYTWANGPIPKGQVVCHTCDNPICVNPSHHWLGTRAQNNADRDQKGRHTPHTGTLNASAKLNEQQVLEIRASKQKIGWLSSFYGVSHYTIKDIRTRRTWRHI